MNITKKDYIWLVAAINTYQECKTKSDWELDDIYFKQSKLVSDANNIEKEDSKTYDAIVINIVQR